MKGSKKMMPAFMKKGAEMGGMKSKPKGKKYAGGGSVGSASKRADGVARHGKTRGTMC